MTQWESLQRLDTVYLQKVFDLYNGDEFSMDVRHYLAHWIEGQDWERASRDSSQAVLLFQVLLENLDNQFSRFAQEKESFLLQRNFRRYKQNFQKYQEEPYTLAAIIHWFLVKEKEILNEAELAQQVKMLQVQPVALELESQRHLEKILKALKTKVEVMEHNIRCLEEHQDEFDFKYQTHQMDSGACTEEEKKKQTEGLQKMLNALDKSRKTFLSDMSIVLDSADSLRSVLVDEELVDWKRRQQKSCIGAPDDTSLEQLEKWFTQMVDSVFQLRKFLQKLDELVGKMSYNNDPIPVQKPLLNNRVDTLLTYLLKSAFIVETQPTMPQGRGPLVLRTNVQFSVRVRFLYKVPELNHVMKVTVSTDKDAPQVKGVRKFNVLGTSSKALNMAESTNGGMVADFRHLTLKDQKVGGGGKVINELSLSVTEELHKVNFETQFDYQGLSVSLETSSLPVVVISNSSQQQSAWASVLWFNMLCSDLKKVKFFESSPVASWSQFGEMLSWQFLSCGKRGLDNDQLETLAIKLFGKQQSYDNCKISWARFSKENIPGTNFTLWVWLDGILNLVKVYLSDLWSDGSIMGFVSKGTEKVLLKKKQNGTFLLRFSESIRDGGITFSWVQYSNYGKPDVRAVQPFTSADLKQIALPEIVRNFQIMEAENVPVNPLCYLYPNTPKDEAFGKYYSEKTGEENPYLKYLKTKLVFVSHKENGCTSVREGPDSDLCTQHREDSHMGLEQHKDPPISEMANEVMLQGPENSPMLSSSTIDADLLNSILEDEFSVPQAFPETDSNISSPCFQDSLPMASVDVLFPEAFSPPDTDVSITLQEFLNEPNILNGMNPCFLQEEPEASIPDHGLQDFGFPFNKPLTP
ncbi:signal transducer and activator of transcription 1-alpha/beta-like isoform X1 [Myxocyprinus asiaticus]|uniref:signal transducer and activator of transcription 1-alpha/beta-like isoform X1 n=1 Tax=Myxocyprinus asiaticus TaxID=70543 RepID=UPI0022230AAE|nr:signal transducer and activator of transcription 1-alpha/beta-like isoform X1 [Myxocyprinus asiaticus]